MIERAGPEKSPEAFRTIGEVAEDLDLPQHVLRFWETRFPQVKPLKRAGGRRFYRPEDVALLRAIKLLLYGQGYTIKGVQKLLQDHGPRGVAATLAAPAGGLARPERSHQGGDTGMTDDDRTCADDGAEAGRRQRQASGGGPSPAQPPARAAMRADVLERLEALSLDLADCARILLAAQSARGRL